MITSRTTCHYVYYRLSRAFRPWASDLRIRRKIDGERASVYTARRAYMRALGYTFGSGDGGINNTLSPGANLTVVDTPYKVAAGRMIKTCS